MTRGRPAGSPNRGEALLRARVEANGGKWLRQMPDYLLTWLDPESGQLKVAFVEEKATRKDLDSEAWFILLVLARGGLPAYVVRTNGTIQSVEDPLPPGITWPDPVPMTKAEVEALLAERPLEA
jgi:hypothetical protein